MGLIIYGLAVVYVFFTPGALPQFQKYEPWIIGSIAIYVTALPWVTVVGLLAIILALISNARRPPESPKSSQKQAMRQRLKD